MAGKGFKNSGVCASEQRLYQQVPVTAPWEKQTVPLLKTNLPEFQKDTYHAYIYSIHKRFLPQTHTSLKSHLIVTEYENLKFAPFPAKALPDWTFFTGAQRVGTARAAFLSLCQNSKHDPAVLSIIQDINNWFFF